MDSRDQYVACSAEGVQKRAVGASFAWAHLIPHWRAREEGAVAALEEPNSKQQVERTSQVEIQQVLQDGRAEGGTDSWLTEYSWPDLLLP